MKTDRKTGHFFAFFRRLLQKLSERDQVLLLSLFVGISCGLASVLLKKAIEFIHFLLTSWFDGEGYNILYLIYPGIGMLIAMLSSAMSSGTTSATE